MTKLRLYKFNNKYIKVQNTHHFGGVAERLKALVLKTSNGATHSWVQIPPPPPLKFKFFKFFRNFIVGDFSIILFFKIPVI